MSGTENHGRVEDCMKNRAVENLKHVSGEIVWNVRSWDEIGNNCHEVIYERNEMLRSVRGFAQLVIHSLSDIDI